MTDLALKIVQFVLIFEQLWLFAGNRRPSRNERGLNEDNFDTKVAIVTLFCFVRKAFV